MAWIEVIAQTTFEDAEALSSLLSDLGALAVTMQDAGDQPVYEPSLGTTPLWDSNIVTGLFEQCANVEYILSILKTRFPHLNLDIKLIPDQEWERAWMKDFHPMQFGKRLWIIPSYQTETPSANQVVLDPGLAFGTGRHPTTALCLQWLDENISGGEVVIDFGCGSGILAIAALKLGAERAIAIDHDPQAILATEENAKKNHIAERQLITCLPEDIPEVKADILIANILANPLMELAPSFAMMLAKNGTIVLSGILDNQASDVVKAYESFFEIISITKLEEWVRIVAKQVPKNNSSIEK